MTSSCKAVWKTAFRLADQGIPRSHNRNGRRTTTSNWERCYTSGVPDPKRVLWYLRKVPLLADLGPDAIARMAERVELREARRRDVIYLPGDPGRSLFFVHGGRIKV